MRFTRLTDVEISYIKWKFRHETIDKIYEALEYADKKLSWKINRDTAMLIKWAIQNVK